MMSDAYGDQTSRDNASSPPAAVGARGGTIGNRVLDVTRATIGVPDVRAEKAEGSAGAEPSRILF
jgi:hypothetical protein